MDYELYSWETNTRTQTMKELKKKKAERKEDVQGLTVILLAMPMASVSLRTQRGLSSGGH